MSYADLRLFVADLEQRGLLKRIKQEISTQLEITEISDRVLRAGGPALLFENVKGHSMPVLTNLFGTAERIALGMGRESADELRSIGELLAYLKEPEPPKGLKDAWEKFPILKKVLHMNPKTVSKPAWRELVFTGDDVDLSKTADSALLATGCSTLAYMGTGGHQRPQ